ncbi:MAG: hypothetical protein ACD_45C00031G0003 [uncultured bacterium]|nr:MAG: hypothetical protein ACD_45C00031G0003 [uncultured bacterium]
MMLHLSERERTRYMQHLQLASMGLSGQLKLKNAKVLCIGAGGLASPLLLYLAAAGVGTIGIVDHDQVALSNLQRQILYTENDIGKQKTDIAKKTLLALNPHITVNLYPYYLDHTYAEELIAQYDIVADCSDNYETRYLVNDSCFTLKKPFVYASIYEYAGQCATFHTINGPCFRCLFREAPVHALPNCRETGVLSVLPGLLGTIQATEVLKFILAHGDLLIGRLLSVDILKMQFKTLNFSKDSTCPLCSSHQKKIDNLTISVQALQTATAMGNEIVLLDVRTLPERTEFNIGGLWIPIDELPKRLQELDPTQNIVVYCRSGTRSQYAVALLKKEHFKQVRSLVGGMKAWQTCG